MVMAGSLQNDAKLVEVLDDLESTTTADIKPQNDVHIFDKVDMRDVDSMVQLLDSHFATSANEFDVINVE